MNNNNFLTLKDSANLIGVNERRMKLIIEKYDGGPVGVETLAAALGEDVKTIEDINEYFSFGCVCVMLARGAIANPFLFEEYHGIFRETDEKIEILINFALRAKELSGEHKALTAMKRFAGAVLKFSQGSAEKRNKACMATSLDEIIKILRR